MEKVIPTRDLGLAFICIPHGYGALKDWLLIRTEDGTVLWKDTEEAFGSGDEASRICEVEEDSRYLLDDRGGRVSACLWDFSQEDPVL
jgi:hypothetical protein